MNDAQVIGKGTFVAFKPRSFNRKQSERVRQLHAPGVFGTEEAARVAALEDLKQIWDCEEDDRGERTEGRLPVGLFWERDMVGNLRACDDQSGMTYQVSKREVQDAAPRVVRLTGSACRRVLEGRAGMMLEVVRAGCGVDGRGVVVLDRRYRERNRHGFAVWSLGADDYEVVA